ncbi:MAG: hypothetical protein HC902_07620 [Calothrix sp. SM1_5_4]|nr:hypothetical protein [Calothrix sp. SM1_5_4]
MNTPQSDIANLEMDDFLGKLKHAERDLPPGPWRVVLSDRDGLAMIYIESADHLLVAEKFRRSEDSAGIEAVKAHMIALCHVRNQFQRILAVVDVLRINQAMKVPFHEVIVEAARQTKLPGHAFPYRL